MGYSELSEIKGKHHRIFCDEETVNSAEYQSFWQDLATGKLHKGEFKRKHRLGHEIWLNANYTPVKNVFGKITGIIKIATDITDMVEARTQSSSLRSAIDTFWASIEFTPEGNILSANSNFLDAMRYSSLRRN